MVFIFTHKEYESTLNAIFQLSNLDITQNLTSFKMNVLQILKHNFYYNHLIFWDIIDGELHENPTILDIEPNTVSDYLTTYKYYDPLHPQNMQNQPAIQLIHQHDQISIKKKIYYENHFLHHTFYNDEMVMYLKNGDAYIAAIGFLRRSYEQKFCANDAIKLSYVHKTLENLYNLYNLSSPLHLSHITPRERELMYYINKGYKNNDIAKLLFVSENTIKKHLQNLYRKLNIQNRTQLALFYQKI